MRKVTAILLAALLALSALACGTAAPAAEDTKPEGTQAEDTTPAAEESGDVTEPEASGDVQDVVFAAWTKEENVVDLTNTFNEDFAGKYNFVYYKLADAQGLTINTALQSGDKIDVMTQASMPDLRQRALDGVYLPLKQFFDAMGTTYAEVFGAANEEIENVNGDYYGVPYNKNTNLVWYNKNMFDEAGIEYPQEGWTWDDFAEICRKLSSGEGADRVYGCMMDIACAGGDFYWDLIARQELGANVYYNEDATASKVDDPMFKTSLEFFYNLANVEKVIVPVEEYAALQYNDDAAGMAGLYNNKFGMFIAPDYAALYLMPQYGEVPEGTNIGLANMPTLDGGQSKTTIYCSTASIPATVEDPEAAFTLLKYIAVDRADLFAGKKSNHPGYEFATEEEASAYNEMVFAGRPGLDTEEAVSIMNGKRIEVSKDCGLPGAVDIEDVMKEDITLVFADEMSIDEALEDMKTRMDEIIANAE